MKFRYAEIPTMTLETGSVKGSFFLLSVKPGKVQVMMTMRKKMRRSITLTGNLHICSR